MEGEIVKVSLIVVIAILLIRALSKIYDPPKPNSSANQNIPKKSNEWWNDFFLYFLLLDLFSFKSDENPPQQEDNYLHTNYLDWFNENGVNSKTIDDTVQQHNKEMDDILNDDNVEDSEYINYDYEDSFGWDSDDSI